jgi:Ankyrin repeats (many copies)
LELSSERNQLCLLVALILLVWSMPRTSERVFAPIQSLTEHLVDIVFLWLIGFRAVKDGDLAKVRKLIAKGENVNVTDSNGGTALQSAAASGDEKMTQLATT